MNEIALEAVLMQVPIRFPIVVLRQHDSERNEGDEIAPRDRRRNSTEAFRGEDFGQSLLEKPAVCLRTTRSFDGREGGIDDEDVMIRVWCWRKRGFSGGELCRHKDHTRNQEESILHRSPARSLFMHGSMGFSTAISRGRYLT